MKKNIPDLSVRITAREMAELRIAGWPTTERRCRDRFSKTDAKFSCIASGGCKGSTKNYLITGNLTKKIVKARERIKKAEEASKKLKALDDEMARDMFEAYKALGDTVQEDHNQEIKARVKHIAIGRTKFSALKKDDTKRLRAKAREWMVAACLKMTKELGLTLKEGKEEFSRQVNAGERILPKDVQLFVPKRKDVHQLTRSSLQRWSDDLRKNGIWGLTDGYGTRKGQSKIETNEDLFRLVMGAMTRNPHINSKDIKAYLSAEYPRLNIVSETALRSFMKKWKADNSQLWSRVTNPDQWKNVFMAAAGSHFENITELNQLWEMDSTPGDWMLTDGRHSVLGVIDMHSRRLKLFVSKTSKALAVCQVFRRAVLDWGVPLGVRTDNGADYVSNQFSGVLRDLSIAHKICIPFASEEKGTIERAMRTMSHGLLKNLPGFIGHNVAERKVIEARKGFSDRIMKKGEVVDVEISSDELQEHLDQWADHVYAKDEHGGLDGKTPWQVASEWTQAIRRIGNEGALDMLLAEVAGVRIVGKKGIRFNNHTYFNKDLFIHVGREAHLRYDERDIGRLKAYIDSNYVGEMICHEILGISRREAAIAAKAKQKQLISEQAKELKKHTKGIHENIAEVVLEHRIRESKNIESFPQRSEEYTSPGLDAAADAFADSMGQKPEAPELSPEDEKLLLEIAAELSAPATQHDINENEDIKGRYARWARIEQKVINGEPVSEELRAQLGRYKVGREYTEMKEFFEEFGLSIEEAES